MCQENEAEGGEIIRKVIDPFIQVIDVMNVLQVLDILYQTEDGFAVPEEEEGVPPPPEGEEEY